MLRIFIVLLGLASSCFAYKDVTNLVSAEIEEGVITVFKAKSTNTIVKTVDASWLECQRYIMLRQSSMGLAMSATVATNVWILVEDPFYKSLLIAFGTLFGCASAVCAISAEHTLCAIFNKH